jgi:hypothetical protein
MDQSLKGREFKEGGSRERKKSLGAVKSGSTYIALAVQYKPWQAPEFSWIACHTAVMGSEFSSGSQGRNPS